MKIIRKDPFDMERFFGDRAFSRLSQWDLAVDVYEEGGMVIAKCAIPGVDASELEVTIEDGALVISGAREEEEEVEDRDYYSKEIRRGAFSRVVELPRTVDAEGSSAEYRDGVLSVSMPALSTKEKGVKVDVTVPNET